MEVKKITDKQIATINKMKGLIEIQGHNELDEIDLNSLSRYDASKIISGLIVISTNNRLIALGHKASDSIFLKALDDVFDTIEKYKK